MPASTNQQCHTCCYVVVDSYQLLDIDVGTQHEQTRVRDRGQVETEGILTADIIRRNLNIALVSEVVRVLGHLCAMAFLLDAGTPWLVGG